MEGVSTPTTCSGGFFANFTGAGGNGQSNDCFTCPATKYCTDGEIKGTNKIWTNSRVLSFPN